MSGDNFQESLSDINCDSFVVLGSGSFLSVENEKSVQKNSITDFESIHSNNDKINIVENMSSNVDNNNNNNRHPESTSQSSSGTSQSINMSPQEKLNQLVKENFQLKETLNQNNLAIRAQLSTFIMWQQEVLKTHESHKQKFFETKDLILKLRAENAELRKQLEENSLVSSFVDEHGESSKFCLECVERKEEITKLQDSYVKEARQNEELMSEKNVLLKTIEQSQKEISQLKNSLDILMKENEKLQETKTDKEMSLGESISTSLLPNFEARLQIRNLLSQLDEERAKVVKLREELAKDKVEEMKTSENKNPEKELSEYIDELNNMDESIQKQSQRINGLNSWIYLAEENLAKSTALLQANNDVDILSEIAQLKSQLNKEEHVGKQRQENLQGIHEQFKKLLQDYKDLQEELNSLKSNESIPDKLKSSIECLSLEIQNKDAALLKKDEELKSLKDTVQKLSKECEDVAALRVQVDLYKMDFNDERAAREKLAGEKENLAEKLRILENVIKDLTKEKEERESSGDSSQKSLQELQPEVSPQTKRAHYTCPKCMFSFSDLRRCQEHIEDCVNIHFYP